MVGISITVADIKTFSSMATKQVSGANLAVKLIQNSEKASSFCNDVIGDICGIVSGSAGVALAALVYSLFTLIVKLAGKENYLLTLSLTKRLFGDKWGKILHYLFFTILPLLISIWLTICVITAVN